MFRRRIVIMNLQITHKENDKKITQVILSVAIRWLRSNAVSK